MTEKINHEYGIIYGIDKYHRGYFTSDVVVDFEYCRTSLSDLEEGDYIVLFESWITRVYKVIKTNKKTVSVRFVLLDDKNRWVEVAGSDTRKIGGIYFNEILSHKVIARRETNEQH